MNHKHRKFWMDKASGGLNLDIYGNMSELDEAEQLIYIETKYRCRNCNGIMQRRIIPETIENKGNTITISAKKQLNHLLPVHCLYCQLTVMPEKPN